ncbi:hypothetical protein BS333_20590 [Vibrio azureus]|uniref:Uncharacterized protein n=2 Tax=Vibrio azureus TaxID=512649 RepID=U3AUL0_9VIBR|nr:hypothetical protein [Vibrio azureus]AUI88686.1 hypothetical protein BS333_20590 [Vibrio azureus]GAD76932.1 hypothetical protein VAZ01S_056_00140 [Vibrio azureus NBRC 104587]
MNKNIPNLPEITEEYKQQQHQAVLDAEVIYEFELIKERKFPYIDAIPFAFLCLAGIWLMFQVPESAWMVATSLLILWVTYRAAGNPDVQQKITLTKKGIIQSELDLIPEGYYKTLRCTGYLVAVLCIIGVFFLGPMMFAGAGAGVLMSFKVTGAKGQAKVWVTPFHHKTDYVHSTYNEASFKNEFQSYDYSLQDKNDEIPYEQTKFFSFRYSAPDEAHKKINAEINKIINITKFYDETDL